jgi:hypothetical protein
MSQTQRNIPDAQWTLYTLFPAASNTGYSTPVWDLVLAGNVCRESFEVLITADATPSLTSGQTAVIALQDSADGTSFTDIADLEPITITAGGSGGAATSKRRMLASTVRQYIRARATMGTGDSSTVGYTLQLVF